ncbi:MAG: bifunctional folylpolyglutamate synthase/dihydrofolate synthase, partial [Steroidobacteraceae bacterium]
AREKAGIFRPGRPAIFGSRDMPASIGEVARQLGSDLQRIGHEFDWTPDGAEWTWRGRDQVLRNLPAPALHGEAQYDNAAAVLTMLQTISARLPVERAAIERGLRSVRLSGRFEILRQREPREIEWILDVAHNPAAARTLAEQLAARRAGGRTIAVCGILGDKDVENIAAELQGSFDSWVVVGLKGARALDGELLAQRLRRAGADVEAIAADVATGCAAAEALAAAGDRIVVFGSFLTVGPALELLSARGLT